MNELEEGIKKIGELLMRGEKELALQLVHSLIDKYGSNKDLELMHAKILMEMNELRVAYAMLNKLYSQYQNDPSVILARGELFFHMKEFTKALSMLEKLIKMQPDNDEAYSLMGRIYTMVNNFEEAERAFKRALEIRDNPSIHNNLAVVLMRAGKMDEALSHLNKAIETFPKIPYLINRAALLLAKGMANEALKDIDRALIECPNHSDLHAYRGHALMCLNKLEEALKEFDVAVNTKKSFGTLSGKAGLLAKMGRIKDAEMYYIMAGEETEDVNERLYLIKKIAELNSGSDVCKKCIAIESIINEDYNVARNMALELNDPLLKLIVDIFEKKNSDIKRDERLQEISPKDWIDKTIIDLINLATLLIQIG